MKAIQHLQLRSNCLYLGSGEDHAEKLSGGFYDHTFIPEYAGDTPDTNISLSPTL